MAQTADPVASSSISLKRIGVNVGAEITDVDLTRPLDERTVEAIRQAHAQYGVVVFPDQKISADDLRRFGRHFGELTVHPFSTSSKEAPELIVYDNKEGNPPPTDTWHSDETFRECPPMGTMLSCKIIPEFGGNTAFCSMIAAYEGLSTRMQAFISGLEAVHDFKSFRKHFDVSTEEGQRRLYKYDLLYPKVTHPVVRVRIRLPARRRSSSTGTSPSLSKGCRRPKASSCSKSCSPRSTRSNISTATAGTRIASFFGTTARCNMQPSTITTPSATSWSASPSKATAPPFGTGDIAAAADLWLRKVPSLMDFPDRPKRQHELG